MAVFEKRETVKDMPAFTIRITREEKERLEEAAYRLRTSMGKLTQRFIAEGLDRLERERAAEAANNKC